MLTDNFCRKLDYLRISVTDKCNLRCSYCMPPGGVKLLSHDEVLRNEEFIHFIRIFMGLGIKKIRFTGGEPLLRKGFIDIVSRTRELFPDLELCVSTNGVLLDDALDDLFSLNIRKLNISLDTISSIRYEEITGRDYFNRVISNIEKALHYDFFDIKINSVLFEETLDELDDYLEFFKDRNVTLRFIEKMPLIDGNIQYNFITSNNLIEKMAKKGRLIRETSLDTRVTLMFDYLFRQKHSMKIGIIPSMTHDICSRCNRLRLTCDGFLRTCLHSNKEYDIKTPYRMDMGDDVIEKIILQSVSEKPKNHKLTQPQNSDGCSSLSYKRAMSRIGG